jgi:two-component system phosphate regulon sensor histidine kinase PhoR
LARGRSAGRCESSPIDPEAEHPRLFVTLDDESDLHAAERARGDFVANASHELRTPLAAILGFVETLHDPNAGGDAQTRARFLSIIENEAKRMRQLVDDLMSLSRIEADNIASRPNRWHCPS